jgi:YtxH-like protein
MSMKKWTGWELDDVLRLASLQRKRSAFGAVAPAVGFTVLGTALGVGVGLMLAPSSGRRLRQDVAERVDQLRERIASRENSRETNNLTAQG